MDYAKVSNYINLIENAMNHKFPSVVYFVLFIGVLGSLSAAFLSHPKGKKLACDLQEVGDDFVSAFERVIDRIQFLEKNHIHSSVDLVDVACAFIHEFRNMYCSAHVHAHVVHLDTQVNGFDSHVAEDTHTSHDHFTEHIQWLQRRGRAIARRSASHF